MGVHDWLIGCDHELTPRRKATLQTLLRFLVAIKPCSKLFQQHRDQCSFCVVKSISRAKPFLSNAHWVDRSFASR